MKCPSPIWVFTFAYMLRAGTRSRLVINKGSVMLVRSLNIDRLAWLPEGWLHWVLAWGMYFGMRSRSMACPGVSSVKRKCVLFMSYVVFCQRQFDVIWCRMLLGHRLHPKHMHEDSLAHTYANILRDRQTWCPRFIAFHSCLWCLYLMIDRIIELGAIGVLYYL